MVAEFVEATGGILMDDFDLDEMKLWDLLPANERFPTSAEQPPIPAQSWAEKLHQILMRHFKNEEAATEFMRFAAGCVLEMPTAELVEAFVIERAAARRLAHDPSQAVVNHLGAFHGTDKRVFSKIHQARTGRGLAQDRETRKTWEKHCKDEGMTCRSVFRPTRRILIPGVRITV